MTSHRPVHEAPGHLALTAARLGAPESGLLPGTSLDQLLEALLAVRPGPVILAGSLAPHWGPRLDAFGRPWRALVLEGHDVLETLMGAVVDAAPGTQVWLNLDRSPSLNFMDLLSLDAFLAYAVSLPEPPLVVLLRDDAPELVRTQRLTVDRLGNVLLLREAGTGAFALGHPDLLRDMAVGVGRPPLPAPSFARGDRHLLVLDVDGVLLDPGRSFSEAVSGALAELEPGLPWDESRYAAFKRLGSFNNDFRLAAGALALFEVHGPDGLERLPQVRFAPLETRMLELEPRCQVMVQKHYQRTRWLERPLVRRQDLDAFKGEVAIFTGRPPEELALAFEVLGFRLPAVADGGAHLRKPRPEGLLQLADCYRAGHITFVGDTCDDSAALSQARALRPDLDWTFAAVGPDRNLFKQEGDLEAEGLLDLLPQLTSWSRR